MATRILQVFFQSSKQRDAENLKDYSDFFNALKNEEEKAINYLYKKTTSSIYAIGKGYKLVDDDIEELICDSITLLLMKIRNEEYTYNGHDPASYVIEVAKMKAMNYMKKNQRSNTVDLEFPDYADVEEDIGDFEQTELLKKWLSKLNDNCQNLIQLKYFDNYRDAELVEKKLTSYSDANTIKNLRARCLKQLIEISKKMNNELF